MEQLILHLIGDYLMQSDWMALNKTKASLPAFIHAFVYSIPFILLKPSLIGWLVIFCTHFLIDRFRLARYIVWAKNWLGPLTRLETDGEVINRLLDYGIISRPIMLDGEGEKMTEALKPENRYTVSCNLSFEECRVTGYAASRPDWLAVWLLIIADNTLHLTINYVALRWL